MFEAITKMVAICLGDVVLKITYMRYFFKKNGENPRNGENKV